MKDNDIKKIFDNAIESDSSSYTDISTEKIQKTVMERLGKEKGVNSKQSSLEEAAKPVYVTKSAKRFRNSFIYIASAAAVCLGIAAIATGFFGLDSNLSTLSGETPAVTEQSDSPQSEQEHISKETSAETEKSETTAAGTMPQSLRGNKLPIKNDTFTLLDGAKIVIENGEAGSIINYSDTGKYLLSEVNGRVYFWNGKEKKDLTDLINTEAPYIESYENEGSGLTHYIVIGGDIPSGKYFYSEMFQTYEREWYYESVTNNIFEESPSVSEDEYEQQWHTEMASINVNMVGEAIKQVSDIPASSYSGAVVHVDFKKVILPIEEGSQDYRGNKLPLKNDSFTLLDKTVIVVEDHMVKGYRNSDADNSVYSLTLDNSLLSEKDGRVYYWNGKEKKDITDLFDTETPFIDSYENEESGLTHYIVVGGDAESGTYFYAELFQTYEKEWHYSAVGYTTESWPLYGFNTKFDPWSDETELMCQNLISNAIRQVCDIPYSSFGGGISYINFKEVVLPCDR